MNTKPKVGILTNFMGHDSRFSLVNVVRVQLQMLLDAGYDPVLFTASEFPRTGIWSGRLFEVRKVAPYDADAGAIYYSLAPMVADIDVMLCHDFLFMSQYKQWGDAVRTLTTEIPRMGFIHWQHSRGGHAPVPPVKASWWAYPNNGDLDHVAEINSAPRERVRYIPHPLDYEYLNWPDLAVRIAEDFDFPFVDVSCLLPTRMDRGKQVEKALRLIAGIKRAGKSVCFLVADAYATGKRFIEYKEELKALGKELGLTEKEFAFLSDYYRECVIGAPHEAIKALYEMSNLFIQPSNAETSSLVVMEAALAGNVCVINADFPPIHHLYGKALSLPFGSVLEPDVKYYRHVKMADGSEIKVEDPQQFFDDQARLTVVPILDNEVAQAVKRQQLRERWPGRVFNEYIEPLIFEVFQQQAGGVPVGAEKAYDPDVTAIITTLDNLPLLKRQVPLLLDTCAWVIVVSNGSKDGTNDWLQENPHSRVKYVIKENNGAGPGRNAGLALWEKECKTKYTLMVDGGILPPVNGVAPLKDYLERHNDVEVVSPEVATSFTTELSAASRIIPDKIEDNWTFPQRCLSSTAYALVRGTAWRVRFSEEGPFGMAGWGVDDNDMAWRWNEAKVLHHDIGKNSGIKLYRRAGGSHKRLMAETGVPAAGYGSVYEQRNVLCIQKWPDHRQMTGKTRVPAVSYVMGPDVPMPEFARIVKRLHDKDKDCEVICRETNYNSVTRWLDTFALRQPHGNVTFDPDGQKLVRGENYREELWSGDVVTWRGPVGEKIVEISATGEEVQVDVNRGSGSDEPSISPGTANGFFKRHDRKASEICGYQINPNWWSRFYEYPWALQYAEEGMVVADMGAGWQYRPFKDALAKICGKVYAVDYGAGLLSQEKAPNMEFVIAGLTKRIEAIPEGSLDRVFCISVLEEIGDGIQLALQEFYTCLKPGGLCCITFDVQYDPEKPVGQYKGVDLDLLMKAVNSVGFQWVGGVDLDRSDAIHNEVFNLCVFHCVLEKPGGISPDRRVAIVHHTHPNFPMIGGFLERAGKEFCHVERFVPGEEPEGFDEYLYLDDSPTNYMEPKYRPAIYYAYDMVIPKLWFLQPAELYFQRMTNFDRVLVSSTAARDYCHERNMDARLLGFAADPEYHHPHDVERDLAWVASWHNTGGRIDATKEAKRLFPTGMVTWRGGDLYSEVISRGKCALNWLRGNLVNMRVFEVMAIGTPLITTCNPDMEYFGFVEGEHYLGFNDLDEMLDKIAWVQAHLEAALEMAVNAREFVLANHTYRHRFLEIFDEH